MAPYRIQQGLRALFAFAYRVDETDVQNLLNVGQLSLFRQLSRSEQLHSLSVLRDVRSQSEHTPRALEVASLLHDIGKTRYRLSVLQKTIAVIIAKIAPAWARRYSQEREHLTYWRAPFVVRYHHPRWGGEMLQQMNADACVVWLVTHHADPAGQHAQHPYYPLLLRLQSADDRN